MDFFSWLVLFAVFAVIFWIYRSTTAKQVEQVRKPVPDQEELAQQRYNAQQWVERNLQAQQRKQYGVKRSYAKAGKTSTKEHSQPAKPASTPMPTPAPASPQSDGFSWPFPSSFSSASSYDEEKQPKFSSGYGGDFGGGGASDSWDSSSSSSDSGSSSND